MKFLFLQDKDNTRRQRHVLERESTAPALPSSPHPLCSLCVYAMYEYAVAAFSLCISALLRLYAMIVPGGPGEVVVGDHDGLGGARGARRVDERARVAGPLGCGFNTDTHNTGTGEWVTTQSGVDKTGTEPGEGGVYIYNLAWLPPYACLLPVHYVTYKSMRVCVPSMRALTAASGTFSPSFMKFSHE